ncbi:MAG: Maf family protein [Caldimonas sp.]
MTGSGSGGERVEHEEQPLQGRDRQSAPTPPFAFIYLASQSPRRRQLLDQIGVRHELLLAGPDEDVEALEAERAGESPLHYVERVTRAKLAAARARRVARDLPAAPILCADTTVALRRRIFGKPRDAADAAATLRLLAGRTHRVITAVAVGAGADEAFAISASSVRFAAIDDREIERYVASGEPFGKAGAYAIQSGAAVWIERVSGSYSGIMGLPLYETARLLRQAGVGFQGTPRTPAPLHARQGE